MGIENNIMSASLFVYTIILIILQGVLLCEFFTRDRQKRKGILLYIFLIFGVAVFLIVDALRNFGVDLSIVVLWMIPFLAVILGSIILWNAYYVGKMVNRKASFVLFLSGFVVMATEILRSFYIDNVHIIFESVVIGAAVLLVWFVVMDFLINSARKSDE